MATLLLWFSILLMQLGGAPAPSTVPNADQPGVFLIVAGPGDLPWEKFGHVMLQIREPSRKFDYAFNWGMFDFEQKNFIWNFIQGRLWYWMDYFDTKRNIQVYLDDDRTMWVQELNLSPAQRRDLMDLCLLNSQPDRRNYMYDYYTDNCSTRVRDKLDEILAGQIKASATTMPSNMTYRSESSRLMSGDPLLYTAINFILGQPIDRKLTAWDEMFIPMHMREHFNHMTISDGSGRQIPLVKNETILHVSKRAPLPDGPPNWIGWFLFAGMLIGGAMVGFGSLTRRASRRAKWGFVAVSVFWSFLAGFAGWFLLYGWFLTDHTAVRSNENILQLSPLLFPLILLIPLAFRGKKRALTIASTLAISALVLSILGLILKVLPMMFQINASMIALAIPANAGLAWSLWRMKTIQKRESA